MGRSRVELTRRKLLQWGVAGFASVYGAKELGWDAVWESVAEAAEAPQETCLVLLYLAGGNDGLNVVLPSGGADYSAYIQARPTIGRKQGATDATAIGSAPLTGPGNALAFANVVVSGTANNGDTKYGFDKLYGDGLGGSGADLAVMPAVDALKYN